MSKPRMVEVTAAAEISRICAASSSLEVPYVYCREGKYWMEADELRAWRESQKEPAR